VNKLDRKLARLQQNKVIIQFAEYMIGGGIYFWGGMATFAVCFELLHFNWFISKGIADILGWSANFAIQRYWAFYSPKLKGKDRQVIFRYVFINAIDLIFDYAIVAAFIYNGITPYAGFVASASFTTVWDYLWYKFWVFKTT
jgi:putative flippase GtrA